MLFCPRTFRSCRDEMRLSPEEESPDSATTEADLGVDGVGELVLLLASATKLCRFLACDPDSMALNSVELPGGGVDGPAFALLPLGMGIWLPPFEQLFRVCVALVWYQAGCEFEK